MPIAPASALPPPACLGGLHGAGASETGTGTAATWIRKWAPASRPASAAPRRAMDSGNGAGRVKVPICVRYRAVAMTKRAGGTHMPQPPSPPRPIMPYRLHASVTRKG